MRTTKSKEKKWAIPGEPLDSDEFTKGIEEAEKGSFYSIEESKQLLKEWRKNKTSR